jgi:hypothetical protein
MRLSWRSVLPDDLEAISRFPLDPEELFISLREPSTH